MTECIRRLAYELWEARQKNNIPGSAEHDWLAAEKWVSIFGGTRTGRFDFKTPNLPTEPRRDPDFPYGYSRGAEGYSMKF